MTFGRSARAMGVAAAAALAAAAAGARAQVLEIGDQGQVAVYAGPSVFDATGVHALARPFSRSVVRPRRRVSLPAADAPTGVAFDRAAQDTALSPDLLSAVALQESRYRADAVSPKGAVGLMQLMPATARDIGVDPADPGQNVAGGALYLRRMLDSFGGDLQLALAAYNAGPGAVRRYGGVPPFAETRAYVQAVMANLSRSALATAQTPETAGVSPVTPSLATRRPAALTLAVAALLVDARAAAAQAVDPAGSGVVLGAASWIQGTLLGNVATAAAVIAIAVVGFTMLTGRMNWRHGATVILGCFVLFGASAIVGGIRTAAQGAVSVSPPEPLERDVVFQALTRPQMFAGVTYSWFVLNLVVTAELFLITKSPLAILAALAIHAVGYVASLREPRFLELWITRASRCARVPNFGLWGRNSYHP